MAIPSRGIGWGTEENLLWQISKQIEKLTCVTAGGCGSIITTTTTSTTAAPVYRVFTALLTQSGGGDPSYISEGDLTIGVTYLIGDGDGGDDFTNVGAPNSNNGTSFVATGTTPNNWTHNAILYYNTGAPVVNVLENTIGNVWFTYEDIGKYAMNSDNITPLKKTAIPNSTFYSYNSESVVTLSTPSFESNTDSKIILTASTVGNVPLALLDSLLINPIFFEVRVYN